MAKYLSTKEHEEARRGIMSENMIKRAQLRIEIGYVKKRITDHKRTINRLQLVGMGLTDQLNKLEKEETAAAIQEERKI